MKRQAEVIFEREGLRIKPSYHPAFVQWLKETVPPSRRRWDSVNREWWIEGEFGEAVLAQVSRFFTVFETDDRSFADKKNRWDHARAGSEFRAKDRADKEAHDAWKKYRGGGAGQFDEAYQRSQQYSSGYQEQEQRQAPPPPRRSQMSTTEAYRTLGLDYGTDYLLVKKAFRKLAIQYHPDRNAGSEEALEMMKKLNEAHSLLRP